MQVRLIPQKKFPLVHNISTYALVSMNFTPAYEDTDKDLINHCSYIFSPNHIWQQIERKADMHDIAQ